MTYIIDRPETIRSEYLELSLVMTDSKTGLHLCTHKICKVNTIDEMDELKEVIIAVNKLEEFSYFCVSMRERLRSIGFSINCYLWDGVFKRCKSILDAWNRLESSGMVNIEWKLDTVFIEQRV